MFIKYCGNLFSFSSLLLLNIFVFPFESTLPIIFMYHGPSGAKII